MNWKYMVARAGLKIRKYAPEICMVAGTAAGVAAIVTVAKQTASANDILERHTEEVRKAHEAREVVLRDNTPDEYTELDEKKNVIIAYRRTIFSLMRHYAVPASLAAFSGACFWTAYWWLKKRNKALTVAYTGLLGLFNTYRGRVRDELGEESDYHFLYGTENRIVEREIVDEKGKTKKVKEEITTTSENPPYISEYAFLFDESNANWVKDANMNKNFVIMQQNYFNDILRIRGHVFLNEVRRQFGLPDTSVGAIVGWVRDGEGDGFIDLGILDTNYERVRDFINGYEPCMWINPNVDGVIFDKI